MRVLVYDCGKAVVIDGKHLKDYPKGVTVEDERGVVYYVSNDRILRDPEPMGLPGMMKLPGLSLA